MKKIEHEDCIEITGGENYMKITECWIFISEDGGGDGVISECIGGTWHPFIASDKKRLESLKPRAVALGKMGNRKIKLIKLSKREDIEVIYDPIKDKH